MLDTAICSLMQQYQCKVAASNAQQPGIELHSYCLHLFMLLLSMHAFQGE